MRTIGFDPRNVGKYGGGAVMNEVCLTQDANQHKMAKCVAVFEMTHCDSPARPCQGGVSPTLQQRMGTGGNQVPLMIEVVK